MANRLTQQPVQVVVAPTSQQARLTQEIVQAVVLPTSQQARLTQLVVQVVVSPVAAPSSGARSWGTIVG